MPDDAGVHAKLYLPDSIVMKRWNRAHVLFRPGILHSSQQFGSTSPPSGGGSITNVSPFGNNFANTGFHVYVFCGGH